MPFEKETKINAFLDQVCCHVRFRRAHDGIRQELGAHIEEQAEAFLSAGAGREEALQKALAEMGDPDLIGVQLNQTHRPQTGWGVLLPAVLLLACGILLSTSFSGSLFFYGGLGILLLSVFSLLDYTWLLRRCWALYGIGVFLLLLALFSSETARGVSVLPIRLTSPASLCTFLLLTSGVGILQKSRGGNYLTFLGVGGILVLPIFLLLLLPSMAGAFLVALPLYLLFWIFSAKGHFSSSKPVLYITLISLLAAPLCIFFAYLPRLSYAFSPEQDPRGRGYLPLLVRNILKESVWLGEVSSGPNGNLPGDQKLSIGEYLPSASSDYVLTYSIGKFGWAAGILILLLIGIFLFFLWKNTWKLQRNGGYPLAFSCALFLSGEFLFAVLENLGGPHLLSFFGFPFLSESGSCCMVNSMVVGIWLSVWRMQRLVSQNSLPDSSSPFSAVERGFSRLISPYLPDGGSQAAEPAEMEAKPQRVLFSCQLIQNQDNKYQLVFSRAKSKSSDS